MTKLMFIFWSAAIVIPSPCRSECEFVTTFQEPFYEGELSEGRLYLVNPSTTDITVEVDTPLIGRTPLAVLNLDAKEQTSVTIPYSLLCNASGYSNKGIRIRSDDDIVVQAISLSAFGTSSWEVPPIEKLGRIHVLMTPMYATVPTNQGSYQILVVAPSAGTTVEVELNGPWDYRVEFDGINYNNSDMIYIELRQYQVAQIQCQQNDGCDMSGTVVISNRPVYVTSGTLSRSSLATSRLSNVISYVPPAERAGKEYIFTFAGVVKIFVFENETSVSISKPIGNTLIQESIHFAFQCKHYSVSASYCLIVDKPVLVSYLPEATSQENPNSFFLFLDAVDHRRSSDYTFATMDSLFGSCTYHLKLQVPTPAISGILIDERHGPWEWQALRLSNISVGTMRIDPGVHRVRQKTGVPFLAVLSTTLCPDGYTLRVSPTPGTDAFVPYAASIQDILSLSSMDGEDLTTTIQITTTTAAAAAKTTTTVDVIIEGGTVSSDRRTEMNSVQTQISSESPLESTATRDDRISRFTSVEAFSSTSEAQTEDKQTVTSTVMDVTELYNNDEDVSGQRSSARISEPQIIDKQTTVSTSTTNIQITSTALDDGVTAFYEGVGNIFGQILKPDVWTLWTECSSTCGNAGVQYRLRICSDSASEVCPFLLHIKNVSIGYAVGYKECAKILCPVDGIYSDWTQWSNCAATCGKGVAQRVRTCWEPTYGGAPCEGPAVEFKPCDIKELCKGTRIAKVFIEPMIDNRPSTLTIGGFGVILVLSVLIAALLLDVPTLIRHLKMAKENITRLNRRHN